MWKTPDEQHNVRTASPQVLLMQFPSKRYTMQRVPRTTMSRVWLTTDTHFQHRKLIEKGFRPADFEAQIIQRWREMVRPHDHIYHLGDVIVGNDTTMVHILESLPGVKTLIRGNHDKRSRTWYRQNGFVDCVDAVVLQDVFLTHEPAKVLPFVCTLNIHGHLHDDNHRRHEYELQPWHQQLALELTGYRPVLLESFRRRS